MNQQGDRIQRKNLFSYPKAQWRIVAFLIFFSIVYCGLNVYVATSGVNAFRHEIGSVPTLDAAARHEVLHMIDQHATTLNIQLAIFSALVVGLLLWTGLVLSHRICGPIGRLHRHLSAIMDGRQDPGPLNFRKDDFFHELADSFNAVQNNYILSKPPQRQDPT